MEPQTALAITPDGALIRRAEGGPVADLSTHPVAVHLAAQTPAARHGVGVSLKTATRILTSGQLDNPLGIDWTKIGFQHLAALIAHLEGEGRKPAGVNHVRSSVLGVLKAAWQLGLIDSDQLLRAQSVKRARGQSLPAGREVRSGEIDALLRVCANDPSPAGARDKAMVAILFGGGLRRSEITGLAMDDFDDQEERLTVRGKGSKERLVPLAVGAAKCVCDWLAFRGTDPGALLQPVDKGGHRQPRAMTTQAVYAVCQRRAAEAGLARFSPHDARRTLASQALDASADIAAVSGLLGHSNVSTTARYDRRGERAKAKVAGSLIVPYYPQAVL